MLQWTWKIHKACNKHIYCISYNIHSFHFWQSDIFHERLLHFYGKYYQFATGTHWDTPILQFWIKHEAYFGELFWPTVCFNPSLRLTENLSFWQFLQFLAISALSADLALREPDYRRKSLVPTPLLCRINSLAQRLRTCGNPTFPLLTSKVRKDPSTARPRWHHSSSHFPIGTLKTKQSKMLQKTSSTIWSASKKMRFPISEHDISLRRRNMEQRDDRDTILRISSHGGTDYMAQGLLLIAIHLKQLYLQDINPLKYI